MIRKITRFGWLALLAALVWPILPAIAAPSSHAEGEHGMVVTAQHEASDVGRQILAAGGNAIDAAVAVGYALAVVDPCCGNIGGGGFMLIHRADGRDTVINFRETAPRAASPDMFLGADGAVIRDASLNGYRAVGVPGTVKGLDHALSTYGRLGRGAVMAPAIALARDGFVLGQADAAIIEERATRLAADAAAAAIFLRAGGSPYRPGDRLVQTDLAATLALIAEEGPDAFYRGPVAAAVARESAAHGGVLTVQDFADYTVTEAAPVTCPYRGYLVLSAPPPSAGEIGVAVARGEPVPPGWVIDKEGKPTTDPRQLRQGGALLPLGGPDGGYKGTGLAVMVEILCGLLTGLGFGVEPTGRHNDGCFMAVFKVDAFRPLAEFKKEVGEFARYLKETPPSEGSQGVLYPGEIEHRRELDRRSNGIDVEDATWNKLIALAEDYQLTE